MKAVKRKAYLPFLVIIGVTVVIGSILTISLRQNLDREKRMVERLLTEQALRIMNTIEILAAMQETETSGTYGSLQNFLEEYGQKSNIYYIAIIDYHGMIQAHTSRIKLYTKFLGIFDAEKVLHANQILTNRVKKQDGTSVFEVTKLFSPYIDQKKVKEASALSRKAISVGIKMNEFEEAESADRDYSYLVTLLLMGVGVASIYFIIISQNYSAVNLALQRMRYYTNNIINSMESGVIAFDNSMRIITMNSAASNLLKVSPDKARGKNMKEILADDPKNEELKKLVQVHGRIPERELDFVDPIGSEIPVAVAKSDIVNEKQEKIGSLLIINDQREIKALKEQVNRTERLAALGQLSAAVAHEIRNPLNAIKGFAQVLKQKIPVKDDKESEYTDIIITEVDRLNRVVEELIQFSKPVELLPQKIDVNEVVKRSLQFIKQDASMQKISIEQGLSPQVPIIQSDPEKLSQVLINIYTNAMNAMPNGGTLTVNTRYEKLNQEQEMVVIEIEDTGKGIPRDVFNRIFDPFFTTRKDGVGLGLTIVHNIMESLGGKIDFISEPGAGTRFILGLPVG